MEGFHAAKDTDRFKRICEDLNNLHGVKFKKEELEIAAYPRWRAEMEKVPRMRA